MNFLKKTIFIMFCMLSLLSIGMSQLTSIENRPVNVKSFSNIDKFQDITFKFRVNPNSSRITFKNAFMIVFPQNSMLGGTSSNAWTSTCSFQVNNVSKTGTLIRDVDYEKNGLFCQYDDTETNGFVLSGVVTLVLNVNMTNFRLNVYNSVSIYLVSSIFNDRIILSSGSSVERLYLLNDFENLQSFSYLKLNNLVVTNTSAIENCASPCTTLYPYATFSLSMVVEVSGLINTYDNSIIISFDSDITFSKLSVTSSSYTEGTYTHKALRAESLFLTKNSSTNYSNSFILNGINEDLISGRKFRLVFTGFSINEENLRPAISKIHLAVMRGNTNALIHYFSDSSIENLTYINQIPFTSIGNGAVSASIEYPNGDVIFENGNYLMRLRVRIPSKVEAGFLTISHISTPTTILSFMASTCDLTENESQIRRCDIFSKENVLRNINSSTSEGVNNSSIKVNLSKTAGASDFILNVWILTNKCNDGNVDNAMNSLTRRKFPLLFSYKYTTNSGNDVAFSRFFATRFECHRTVTVRNSSLDIADFSGASYSVYRESSEWNFSSLTFETNPQALQWTKSVLTSNDLFLNTISADINSLSFNINVNNSRHLPWPTEYDTLKDTYTEYKGKLDLRLNGAFISRNSVADGNCYLRWFIKEDGNNSFIQDVFSNESTSSNPYHKLSKITSNSIVSELLSGTETKDTVEHTLKNYVGDISAYLNGLKTMTSIGFNTNCFAIKKYDSISFKSIYSAYVDFRIMNTDINGNFTRILRLIKFFPALNSFSNNSLAMPNNPFKLWGIKVGNSSLNNLCILEVSGEVFDLLDSTDNTILLRFLNMKLPYVDSEFYPTFNSLSNITAYPIFDEPTTTALSSTNTANDTRLIRLSPTDNMYFTNRSFMGNVGSNLIIKGIANKRVTKQTELNTNTELYIPIWCQSSTINREGYQALTISFLRTTDSNQITGNKITPVVSGNLLSIHDNSLSTSSTTPSTFISSFSHYTDAFTGDENYNIYRLSTRLTNGNEPRLNTLLVLSNLAESSVSDKSFYGNTVLSANITKSTIGGKTYENMYLTVNKQGISYNTFNSVFINRFLRPSLSDNSKNLQLTGYFSYGTDNITMTTKMLAVSTSIVSLPANKLYNDLNTEYFSVVTKVRNAEVFYINDYGLNMNFEFTINSNYAYNTGLLTFQLDAHIKPKSHCVFEQNPLVSCSIVSVPNSTIQYVQCENVSVSNKMDNKVVITCFNLYSGSNGIFTIEKSLTRFTVNDAIEFNLLQNYVVDYVFTTKAVNVNQIVPAITSIDFTQSNQQKGLAVAYIKVDLGRGLRLGQRIILNGSFSDLYISGSNPTCQYFFNNVENKENLDLTYQTNVENSSNVYIGNCILSTQSLDSQSIEIVTKNKEDYGQFFTPQGIVDSRYVTIKLFPVYSFNMLDKAKSKYYSIRSFLERDELTQICSDPKEGNNRDSFPELNPKFNSLFIEVVPQVNSSLCNLSNISPKLSSVNGLYTFNLNLNGTKSLLDSNTSNVLKEFNEVSIFLNQNVFLINKEYLRCEIEENGNSYFTPCTYSPSGFLNIRLYQKLEPESQSRIMIRGIINPDMDKLLSHTFDCSVNYFNSESRENLVVGQGKLVTFIPKITGNLVFSNIKQSYSDLNPRSYGRYSFRFYPDNATMINNNVQVFELSETKRPVLIISFPINYDFSFSKKNINFYLTMVSYSSDNTVSRQDAIARSQNSTDTTSQTAETYGIYYDNRLEQSLKIYESRLEGNSIIILFDQTIEFNQTTAFVEITLENVMNPLNQGQTLPIEFTLMDDMTNSSKAFSTFGNVNNHYGELINTNEKLFNNGFRYQYTNSKKYLVGLSSIRSSQNYSQNFEKFQTYPGRYTSVNFVMSGEGERASVDLRLNEVQNIKGTTFSSLDNPISFSSRQNNRNKVMRIGNPCNTIEGDYILSFSLENAKVFNNTDLSALDHFYELAPIMVNVGKLLNNFGQIKFSLFGDSIQSTSFSMNPNMIMLQAVSSDLPYEEIRFSLKNLTTNSSEFRNTTSNADQTIFARTNEAYFDFVAQLGLTKQPQIEVTSENSCFRFGSLRSTILRFTVTNLVADLSKVKINREDFKYENMDNNSALSANDLSFIQTSIPSRSLNIYVLRCANENIVNPIAHYRSMKKMDPLNHSSAMTSQAQIKIINTLVDITNFRITFNNLLRGVNYNLDVLTYNFNMTNFTDISSFTYKNMSSINTTNSTTPLKTKESLEDLYFGFYFNTSQSQAILDRIASGVQSYISTITNANLLVYDLTLKPILSYNEEKVDVSCYNKENVVDLSFQIPPSSNNSIPNNTNNETIISPNNNTSTNNTNQNNNSTNTGNTTINNSTSNQTSSTNGTNENSTQTLRYLKESRFLQESAANTTSNVTTNNQTNNNSTSNNSTENNSTSNNNTNTGNPNNSTSNNQTSNNQTNNTVVDEYPEKYYLKITQAKNDRNYVDLSDLLKKLGDEFNGSRENFNKNFGIESSLTLLKGKYQFHNIIPRRMNRPYIYNSFYSNGEIKYMSNIDPFYNLTHCNYKVTPFSNKYHENKTMSLQEVRDCSNDLSFYGITSDVSRRLAYFNQDRDEIKNQYAIKCGTVEFNDYNQNKTIIVGDLPYGNYTVNFACVSPITVNPDQKLFRGEIITIEEKIIPEEHQIFYNCTVNRTSQYCFSSMISASSIIMLLLAFLMFN